MSAQTEPAARRWIIPTYRLKIVLLDTEPTIWRLLQVPGHANLGWFHAALQVAMGWTNSHLHMFLANGARYTDPRQEVDMMPNQARNDETTTVLMQIAPETGAQFDYDYDFGDSWRHSITVTEILPPEEAVSTTPVCLDGARACPPEDCGGIWGYQNLVKTLENKKHPDYKSMQQWLGRPFKPEAFHMRKTNLWLRKLNWPHVTEDQLRKVLMGRDGYRE